MSFPRYDELKASGIEWLGKVPTHWSVGRFKLSTKSCRNGIWGGEATGDVTDIKCVRVADFDRDKLVVVDNVPTVRSVTTSEQEKRILSRGNLLLEKSGGGENQPVGFVVLFDSDEPAVCSNFVAKIELADRMNPSYWRYCHAAAYAIRLNCRSIKQISGIQNLDQSQYLDEIAPCPPLNEQLAIASFLDRETSKIDTLVSEQRRLVELLKEKRQAVISHAVTKGLVPTVPMKPSGIPWLGDVPKHWETVTVRRVLSGIEQGWSPQCDERPAADEEWGVLKTGCVNRGVFNPNENKVLPEQFDPISEFEVKCGDVLMSRASGSPNLVGATAYVYGTRSRLMLSDTTFRIQLIVDADPEFFVAVFNSHSMRTQIEQSISGAEGLANNLPQSKLRDFALSLPPLEKQRRIVIEIGRRLGEFNSLIGEAERAISLLQERRTALISAAVTGKIDVRDFTLTGVQP